MPQVEGVVRRVREQARSVVALPGFVRGAREPTVLAGRYRIDRLLGRGGSAEVYAATLQGDGGFQRRVAIKILAHDVPADGPIARSFQEEARIAGLMSHPNLVGVLDAGIEKGQRFLVMELVDGLDLLSLRDAAAALRRPMPPELALHVVLEVALGLAYAHGVRSASGSPTHLVHRDVSPRNVLAAWNGAVKLTDFGIARWEGRCLEQTPAGAFRGTLLYAAPERLLGAPGDARSDVFSLGCLLHFLAAGRSPQRNEATLVAFSVGKAPMPIDPAVHRALRPIIERATRRDPAERYASASELAREASALLARTPRDRNLAFAAWLDLVRRGDAAPVRTRPRPAPDADAASPAAPLARRSVHQRAWQALVTLLRAVWRR
jgi:serine/threonine protein kinase